MSTNQGNSDQSSQDPRDPEAILRVMLGSAAGTEERSVRDAVASDPDAARLAGILAEMRAAFVAERDEAADAPPASLFEKARALGAELPVPPSWLQRTGALFLARIDGAFDAMLGSAAPQPVPALRGASGENLATFEGGSVRLDASSVRERDGSVILVVQREVARGAVEEPASLAGECAVLDADSGAILATTLLGDEGSAVVRLEGDAARARAVDIALRTDGGACVARGILLA
jgi:hypothetical protein